MFQKAYFYPLFAILFWAGNVVVSKMASHAISPVAITFYRLVLALTVMSTFVLIPVWKNRQAIKQYWKQLPWWLLPLDRTKTEIEILKENHQAPTVSNTA